MNKRWNYIWLNTTTTRQLCASSREHQYSMGSRETESQSNTRDDYIVEPQNIEWEGEFWMKKKTSDSHLNTKAIYNIFIFYVPLSIRYGLNYQKKRLNGANKLHFLDHHFHPPGFFSFSTSRHKMTSHRLGSFFFCFFAWWKYTLSQFNSVQFEFRKFKREKKNGEEFSGIFTNNGHFKDAPILYWSSISNFLTLVYILFALFLFGWTKKKNIPFLWCI